MCYKKKAMALLLSAVMILSLGLPAFAEQQTSTAVFNAVCVHHQEHTVNCGYIEQTGAACSYICAICGTKSTEETLGEEVQTTEETLGETESTTEEALDEMESTTEEALGETESTTEEALDEMESTTEEVLDETETDPALLLSQVADFNLQTSEVMTFYIQVVDENGTPIKGSLKYEPGLMSDIQYHDSPNAFGTVCLNVEKTSNNLYNYFQYGICDSYKDLTKADLTLPVSGTLIKVQLALKNSSEETTVTAIILPTDEAYPEDPMNPGAQASATKTLRGLVKDATGAGIAGADVTIQHSYKPFTRTVQTDSNGSYIMEKVPQTQFGTASLSAYKQGYTMSGAYTNDFTLWNETTSYDFTAKPTGGSPSDTYKEMICSISGAPSGLAIDITFAASNMETQSITGKGSSSVTCNLDKVLYTGKTVTITPKARAYKFTPSSMEIAFDSYASGTALSFRCESDGTRDLWVTAADQSEKDIYNVKYTVSAGETCEYYTAAANSSTAQIYLYDAFYLNKRVTVIPSKEGYTFEPSYITFEYGPGGNRYMYNIKGTKDTETTARNLTAIVTDGKTGKAIAGVKVSLATAIIKEGTTDNNGMCILSGLKETDFPKGVAELQLTKEGYSFAPRLITFADVGTIALSQNESVNNNPKKVSITLLENPAAGGKAYGGGIVPANEAVWLMAVPGAGYRFTGWSTIPGAIAESTDANYMYLPKQNITLYANFAVDAEAPVPTTYALTIVPNIAEAGSVTGNGFYPEGSRVQLHANANAGYKFVCWQEGDKILSFKTPFQLTIMNKERNLTAVYESTDASVLDPDQPVQPNPEPSNPGSGGSDTSKSGKAETKAADSKTPPLIAESKERAQFVSGKVATHATVDKDGNTHVTIADQVISDAIRQAQNKAIANGTEKNGISLRIDASTEAPSAALLVTLPKTVQDMFISAAVRELTVLNQDVEMTFDLEAMKQINASANADVVVSAVKVNPATLSKEAQTVFGNRPVYTFTVASGDKTFNHFGKGEVSVSMPYTPAAGEKTGNMVAVSIDGINPARYITKSAYNSSLGAMTFVENNFTTCGIAYKSDAPVYSDIQNHWAQDDIEFMAARDLLTGTDPQAFEPDAAVTREAFTSALEKLYGGKMSVDICVGVQSETFITREEMALIMANYAAATEYVIPKLCDALPFADEKQVGGAAAIAVHSMQQMGVISGKSDGNFEPKSVVGRAEMSAMLHQFIERSIYPAILPSKE